MFGKKSRVKIDGFEFETYRDPDDLGDDVTVVHQDLQKNVDADPESMEEFWTSRESLVEEREYSGPGVEKSTDQVLDELEDQKREADVCEPDDLQSNVAGGMYKNGRWR